MSATCIRCSATVRPRRPWSSPGPLCASCRRRTRTPERAVQAAGVRLLRSLGASVYVLGTVRPRGDYPGTRQTPGLPDVWAMWPSRRLDRPRALWWEVKAKGGRIRPEQVRFGWEAEQANIAWVVGDLDALLAWLECHGYCRRAGGPGCTAVEVR